jgi:peptidoglycan/LPS O-acetylase OafA/YrhL
LAASSRAYRPDIDGLRAIAILSVVLNHARVPWLTGGFTGVDIFFVISGYLIGGHIYAELRNGTFSFARFYQRRAKRILPALYAVLAASIAAALVLLSPAEAARLARAAFAATLSASNILFWHSANYFDVRGEMNPLLMTWSLGVEEQFYAAIPLLMVLLARVRREWMLGAVMLASAASLALAWVALGEHPSLVFYMLPARAWELGAGVALAVVELDGWRGLRGRLAELAGAAALALMIAPLFLLNSASAFPGPAALPSVMGAVGAIAVPASWVNRRLLSASPLVFIGKVSYSWYLGHWPLMAFAHIVYGGEAPRVVLFGAIAVSFGAAVLSYVLIEQPFRASRRGPGPLLARYAVASALMLALSVVVWATGGVAARYPALAQLDEANAVLYTDPCLVDSGDYQPNFSAPCNDAVDARPVVALWGDSHAAALAPALRELAHARGYAFIELTKSSCPPLTGATHYVPRNARLAAACVRYNERVLEALKHDPRIRVVILNCAWAGYLHRSWQDGWLVADIARRREMPEEGVAQVMLTQGLESTLGALRAAGKHVMILGDVPTFDFEPVWRIETEQILARRELARLLRVQGAEDTGSGAPNDGEAVALSTALLDRAADGADVELVNLRAAFCDTRDKCKYRDGSHLLYADNNHLSPEGARYALRGFRLPELVGAGDTSAHEAGGR